VGRVLRCSRALPYVLASVALVICGVLIAGAIPRAPAAALADTTTEPAPTTTTAATTTTPVPDPAPTPAPKPKPPPAPKPHKPAAAPPSKRATAQTHTTPVPTQTTPATTSNLTSPVAPAKSAPRTKSAPVHRARHHRRRRAAAHRAPVAKTRSNSPLGGRLPKPAAEKAAFLLSNAQPKKSNAGLHLLFVTWLLALSLVLLVAALVPASPMRYTLVGRRIADHRADLAILGVLALMETLLIYVIAR
jgi:type IV secretory pathway VirB10-like protein